MILCAIYTVSLFPVLHSSSIAEDDGSYPSPALRLGLAEGRVKHHKVVPLFQKPLHHSRPHFTQPNIAKIHTILSYSIKGISFHFSMTPITNRHAASTSSVVVGVLFLFTRALRFNKKMFFESVY